MLSLSSIAKPVLNGICFIAITYVFVLIIFAVFQRSLSYYPGKTKFVPAEWDLNEFKLITVKTQDGLTLNSWYAEPKENPGTIIVYFQGNASHFGVRNEKIRPWLNAGYGALLVGYRGYNGNRGKPTEEGLYNDARAAISALLAHNPPKKTVIFYGESLGTGIAAQMATEYHPTALILEAPFTSFPDVGAYHYPWLPVRLLLRDQYNSLEKIGKVHAPLLLIHGEIDNIVPFALGKKLFEAANEPKKAVFIPQAGHNDLYDHGAGKAVMDFLHDFSAK